jgi:molybdopterin converting factor subunit 1
MTTLSQPAVRVRVLLFARFAELAGRSELELSLPAPATVSDVLRLVRGSLPGAERLPDRPLAAVNQVHAQAHSVVRDGDEIAFLPPLAGG